MDPARWSDQDMRAAGFSPERVRRWFKQAHGMTFRAYSRARRLGSALGQVNKGSRVSSAAFDTGYESLSGFQEAFRRYFGSPPTDLGHSTGGTRGSNLAAAGPHARGSDGRGPLPFGVCRSPCATDADSADLQRPWAVFVPGRNELIDRTANEVVSYFDGSLRDFTVPTAAPGTDFQQDVWGALCEIPYGETRSYGELAATVGRPAAVRAVGRVNDLNALAIVVPCHRLVGAAGKLVGYGGGVWRKQKLLSIESV